MIQSAIAGPKPGWEKGKIYAADSQMLKFCQNTKNMNLNWPK